MRVTPIVLSFAIVYRAKYVKFVTCSIFSVTVVERELEISFESKIFSLRTFKRLVRLEQR